MNDHKIPGTLPGWLAPHAVEVAEWGATPDARECWVADCHRDAHLHGLCKTPFFGLEIALIGCYNGLSATGGADGVGRATTVAVVVASITILITDFFLSKLFIALPIG